MGSFSPQGSWNGMPMMGTFLNNEGISSNQTDAEQANQAKGKDLYQQLQAKKINCSDLTKDDYDAIGDYVMGQNAGDAHEQMDSAMEQMMGSENTEQMHMLMGERATGCVYDVDYMGGRGTGMMQ